MFNKLIIIIIFLGCVFKSSAENIIVYNGKEIIRNLGNNFEILNDSAKQYNDTSILSARTFQQINKKNLVFPFPNVDVWIRFYVKNQTKSEDGFFYVDYFNISNIYLYKIVHKNLVPIYFDGNALVHSYNNSLPNYIANLHLSKGTDTFYLHITTFHPLVLTSYISTYKTIQSQSEIQIIIIAAYLGILLTIFLYNLFLFFATNDRNYFLYVLYILFLGFAQFTLAGYSFKFLWPTHPNINFYAVPIASELATIFGVLFSLEFLRVKYYISALHKILLATVFFNVISIFASLFHFNKLSYTILSYNTPIVGFSVITSAIYIIYKGYRPAFYYAISWIFFLTGLIIFSLRNFNVLPTNFFTTYILYFGSALETVLLSIALADKINILKKEKEISQAEALQSAKENEQLVRDQNVVLEQKVDQRTHELKETNVQLNTALDDLKDAQTQLVEAEKMASLGQLTAGIAHEINNPINFVKSNINPLRLDVKDLVDVLNEYEHLHNLNEEATYKKKLTEIEKFKNQIDVKFVQNEINSLIIGIEDGAQRTAEIVQGLRTFSRIDEAELKTVDVHEGILSTLVILKNSTPYFIQVKKEFNANGTVECYPGKLNQVFMNIITNAVQAIKAKKEKNAEESVIISTKDVQNDCIQISIKDTGIGMTEDTKHRIFEPFFTTKDVGEGTGLGMAIVFKIIQKHEGKIDILSKPFEGSEFIITLPHKHPISDHHL